jgi:hypothetical protein
MNVNLSDKRIRESGTIYEFINYLKSNQVRFNLSNANIYCDFPVYKDLDEDIVVAQLLILSDWHGLLLFHISDIVKSEEFINKVPSISSSLDNLYSILYSRLLRNKELKSDRTTLSFKIETKYMTKFAHNY